MWKPVVVSAALVLSGGLWFSGSQAQQVVTVSEADRHFMMHAAQGGVGEVELGRLAAGRGANDAVRQFGQRMVSDHGAADAELRAMASRRGMALPGEMGVHHRATYDRLASLSGQEFDRAYLLEMVNDHAKDASAFERASQTAQDPEVRAWAAQTLPVIRAHQNLARQLHGILAQVFPAAMPTALVVIPAAPEPLWCGGAWQRAGGTNFSGCSR